LGELAIVLRGDIQVFQSFLNHHLHLIHHFAQFLHSYGYLALFLALVIEYLVFLIPGETFLLVAGAYAATGRLSLPVVILASAAGAAVGLNNAYWIGRAGGEAFLTGHASRFRVNSVHLERLQRFFDRHGSMAVFSLRFVTVLRILVGYLAGVQRMPFRVFTVFNVLGALVWATAIGLLGYLFADSLRLLSRFLTDTALAIAGIVVLAAIIFWTRRERTACTATPNVHDTAAFKQ
jgi:membrane protein DedA with SNARE-associated domain